MKVDLYETHDRLLHFKKDQSQTIFQGAESCLKEHPWSQIMQANSPYVYLFCHPRTDDDGVTKRFIWQPRLTKPLAQTNSYLFRAISNTDVVEIVWLLPPREMWAQFEKGKVTESEDVLISIDNFENHREEMNRPHKDDLPDERTREIYKLIYNAASKQASLEAWSSSFP